MPNMSRFCGRTAIVLIALLGLTACDLDVVDWTEVGKRKVGNDLQFFVAQCSDNEPGGGDIVEVEVRVSPDRMPDELLDPYGDGGYLTDDEFVELLDATVDAWEVVPSQLIESSDGSIVIVEGFATMATSSTEHNSDSSVYISYELERNDGEFEFGEDGTCCESFRSCPAINGT